MRNNVIIAWYAGIWKSTLGKKYANVIDLESSHFKWDNTWLEHISIEQRKWLIKKINSNRPQNYINAIQDNKEIYDIVLVWIHPEALDVYEGANINYVLCYPEKSSLGLYKERYINRWNNPEYIERVINGYDNRYNKIKDKKTEHMVLHGDENLEDYLIKKWYNLVLKDKI